MLVYYHLLFFIYELVTEVSQYSRGLLAGLTME
jgi:hypothetical protein